MTAKEQLLQELPQLTEDLASQVLHFSDRPKPHPPQAPMLRRQGHDRHPQKPPYYDRSIWDFLPTGG
jgi:hypothetical protein